MPLWGVRTPSVRRPKCAVKHSSTSMVGEASVHVQGASLKMLAALLTEASQLPDHQDGELSCDRFSESLRTYLCCLFCRS